MRLRSWVKKDKWTRWHFVLNRKCRYSSPQGGLIRLSNRPKIADRCASCQSYYEALREVTKGATKPSLIEQAYNKRIKND